MAPGPRALRVRPGRAIERRKAEAVFCHFAPGRAPPVPGNAGAAWGSEGPEGLGWGGAAGPGPWRGLRRHCGPEEDRIGH